MMENEYHSPLPRDDAKTPDQAIRKIRYSNREHLYIFKGGKQIRRFLGETDRVTLPQRYLFEMKDAVILHNHPFGTSFSREDVEMVIAHNAKKLIVVTAEFSYTITRPSNGWPVELDEQWIRANFETCKHIAEEMANKLVSQHQIRWSEKDATIIHYIWVLFFYRTDIQYVKKELDT
jgi:hypothetical protein